MCKYYCKYKEDKHKEYKCKKNKEYKSKCKNKKDHGYSY